MKIGIVGQIINKSVIEKTYLRKSPPPLFAKEGKTLPFAKGGKGGIRALMPGQLWTNYFTLK
jgi:hypothetical protein